MKPARPLTSQERAYIVTGLRFCPSVAVAVAYASLMAGRPIPLEEVWRLLGHRE